MNAELVDLLDKRMNIRRGRTLEAKLKRAGRLIPKGRRKDGEKLVEAEKMAGNPKLMRLLDYEGLRESHHRLKAYLQTIDYWDRLRGKALGIITPIAFNFLLLAAVGIAVARYQGWIGP